MSKLEQLKTEARELGIQFSPNISEEKLAERIENYYKSKETSKVKVKEEAESGSIDEKLDPEIEWRRYVAEKEKRSRKTRIIEIVDNDQRENNHTTSVTVTCANQEFELGTKILPLNKPVEVEQGFIDVLKSIKIPMHMKQRDGNYKIESRYRYSIIYRDDLEKNKDK